MAHPLDNPVWSALHSAQAPLAEGEGRAVRYLRDHAIFAAVGDREAASIAALETLIAATGPAILFARDMLPPVPGTRVERRAAGVQMVAEAVAPADAGQAIVELGDGDAAEMLALAQATEPGPFFARTHRMGRFVGVRVEGRLVAMAGERIRLGGYTEVSGVCTAPEHRGKGLAGTLIRAVADGIAARGETAFLHAWADDPAAIALYRRIGFRERCDMAVTVLAPA